MVGAEAMSADRAALYAAYAVLIERLGPCNTEGMLNDEQIDEPLKVGVAFFAAIKCAAVYGVDDPEEIVANALWLYLQADSIISIDELHPRSGVGLAFTMFARAVEAIAKERT